MRVALFTDTYAPEVNGVAGTLQRWVKFLRSRGIACKVFAPTSPEADDRTDRIVERYFSVPFVLYPECHFTLPNPIQMKKALQQFQPTIIHVATPFNLGMFGSRYAAKHDIPSVASYHTHFDLYLDYYKLNWMEPFLWKYLTWFHSSFQKVYVPSRSALLHLQDRGFSNMEIWGRGIDAAEYPAEIDRVKTLRSFGADPERFTVLYVGRLAAEKRIHMLIEAFLAVPESQRNRMQLIAAGDGPLYKELSETYGEGSSIILPGFVQGVRLKELYASADVFLFPSATETFGNVVLESSASGTPVIGAASGGVQDLVQHRVTGLLCPPDDVHGFTRSLIELHNDQDLRSRLGTAAKAYAAGQTWEHIFERLLSSYEQVLSESFARKKREQVLFI